jgi:hypothetical protein
MPARELIGFGRVTLAQGTAEVRAKTSPHSLCRAATS